MTTSNPLFRVFCTHSAINELIASMSSLLDSTPPDELDLNPIKQSLIGLQNHNASLMASVAKKIFVQPENLNDAQQESVHAG